MTLPQLLASADLETPMAANPSPNEAPVAAKPKPSEAAAAKRIAMHAVTDIFADPCEERCIDDDSRSLFARRMTERIPRDAPRSEYDSDIEAPAAAVATPIALHPVTGAFADPAHERAFAAYFFRLCFGVHIVSMTLFLFTVACGTAALSMEVEVTSGYRGLTAF